MFTLGLVSITFRKHTPEEILDACVKCGLSAIEWGSDVHVPVGDLARAAEVRAMSEKAGVRIAAYGSYYKLGEPDNDEKRMRAYLESAKALGAPMIRIWGGKKASDQFLRADRAAFVSELKTFTSLAKTYGITLALECHRDTITDEYHNTFALLKEVGADNLTSFWQPLQSRTESYNLDSAAAHAPFVRHIHVFHWDTDEWYPLGEGHDIWCKYLAPFKGTNTDLMLEFMHDNRMESLASTVEALRAIVRDAEAN